MIDALKLKADKSVKAIEEARGRHEEHGRRLKTILTYRGHVGTGGFAVQGLEELLADMKIGEDAGHHMPGLRTAVEKAISDVRTAVDLEIIHAAKTIEEED